MLESQLWKSKIITKMERLKRWCYFSKLLTITITSFNFFNCPVKLQNNLKLKFSLKFYHDLTNHGYLHNFVWKTLHHFKIKRAQLVIHNQFSFQNVQNNEIFEILKTTGESTCTTKNSNTFNPWTDCSVFNWNTFFE